MASLTTQKANLSAIENQLAALTEKQAAAESERIALQQRFNQAAANLTAIEKKHILDLASDQELTAARKTQADLTEQVAAVDRRCELISEAISETSEQIQQAQAALQTAIFEHCQNERDQSLRKIQSDPKLRENLLASMASWASNGKMHYAVDTKLFIQQYIDQIVPEISREEVQAAIEKFNKNNGL